MAWIIISGRVAISGPILSVCLVILERREFYRVRADGCSAYRGGLGHPIGMSGSYFEVKLPPNLGMRYGVEIPW